MANYFAGDLQLVAGDVMLLNNLGHFVVDGFAPITTDQPTVVVPKNHRSEILELSTDIANPISRLTTTEYDSTEEAISALETSEDAIFLKENLIFEWGSLSNGGVAYGNINSSTCWLYMFCGIYENSNHKFQVNCVSIEFPYDITVNNSAQATEVAKIVCKPVDDGIYENSLMFVQIWVWNEEEEKVEFSNQVGYCMGLIPAEQSYATEDPIIPLSEKVIWQPVVFWDTASHISEVWTNQFTMELPTESMWDTFGDPTYGYTYYASRSAQRRLYSISGYLIDMTTSKGGNVFGGGTRNNDAYVGDPSTTDDEGAQQNRYSEPIDADDLPAENFLNCGFVNLYNPSKLECKDLVHFLYADISTSIVDAVKNMLSSPLDAILCAHMIHFKPSIDGIEEIKFCGFATGCQAYTIDEQYYESIYEIEIGEWWNSFVDYERTKMMVFLPYIGIRDVEAKHFLKSTMKITYKWDIVSGMCTALIYSLKTNQRGGGDFSAPLYQFSGNFILPIPLTSANWSSTFQTLVNSAGAIMNPVSSIQGALSNVGSAIGTMVGSLATPMMSVQHSGNISANAGYNGYQQPYLILFRPDLSTPSHYATKVGIPANITQTIANYTRTQKKKDGGWYIKAKGEVYTGHIHATDEERDMIKSALLNGIWING